MPNFFVTGGAGFIGSNIVEELLKRGHSVRVIDNFSTGKRENLAPFLNQESRAKNFELIEGDICDLDLLRSAMSAPFSTSTCSGRVDFVLHQAALPSVPRSIQDPATTHEVNATGTLNVLIAARDCGVKRVVYASSSSVYGDSEELPKYEGMIPNPLSPYAVSKLMGEYYCRVFSRLYGLETVVLRYFNVFGPRQDPTSQYAGVIPKFISAIRNGERPVIYGDGEQSRDFIYVANVVAANLAACVVPLAGEDQGQQTKNFLLSNVGSGERHTVNYLFQELCRLLGKQIEPIYAPARTGDVRHSLASINVLKDRLGVCQRIGFTEGLAKLVRMGC
ncbi:MAG: SDR family oxidoreductase [bacterium]